MNVIEKVGLLLEKKNSLEASYTVATGESLCEHYRTTLKGMAILFSDYGFPIVTAPTVIFCRCQHWLTLILRSSAPAFESRKTPIYIIRAQCQICVQSGLW